MLAGLLVAGPELTQAGVTMLLNTDFEQSPQQDGWEYVRDEQGEPTGEWTQVQAHSGGFCLAARTGKWQSPPVVVTPFQYYRLQFWSQTEEKGYWAAFFYDAAGKFLQADHYSSIDPSAHFQRNVFCFRARARAATARIIFQPRSDKVLYVDDVSLESVDRAVVAQWADSIYSTIPPARLTHRPDRWGYLPRTMERLQSGGTLRVVILGDSIACDTGNSAVDVLLERLYPAAHVELITSTRGGTGCQYYEQDNRVQEYVIRYHPDLLIIGGISNRGQVEAIRSVIHQVQQAISPEIMVITGAFGQDRSPREIKDWTPAMDLDGPGYRQALRQMAAEEQLEFFDCRGLWAQYLNVCDQPYHYFLRDPVHPNARGRQILARILEGYFAPKTPTP